MIKRVLLASILSGLILITACIDSTTTISVRKDGSGTITEVVYMDQSMMAMMEGMMGQMGEKGKENLDLFDIEDFKSKAVRMGAGVTFQSKKEITGKDGSPGVEVIYSFDDIRALNIQAQPENPVGDNMAGMMAAESGEPSDDPITFDFIKGSTSTLIINMPKDEESDIDEEPPETSAEDMEGAGEGMAMMSQFMQGFRIRIIINLLEGKIKKTNASFVETIDGRDTVTLLDIAMGEILSNEEYAREFGNMEQIKDMNVAMEKMKKIPGLKIEVQERVEVNFK